MKMQLATCLLIGSSLTVLGQSRSAATAPIASNAPQVLSERTTVQFNVPKFGSIGSPVCDSSGDTYFNVGVGIGKVGPFLGILHGGYGYRVFELPANLKPLGILLMAVSPHGTFYVLYGNLRAGDAGGYTLFEFRNDGSLERSAVLHLPPHTTIQHFAVANSGEVFVSGYRESSNRKSPMQPAFSAILNDSGDIFRDLSSGFPNQDVNAPHPPDGGVVAADNGRFYVLDSNHINVYNQSGDIENTWTFRMPDKSSYTGRIDVSEGAISVSLNTIGKDREIRSRMLLIDAQTGAQLGDYAFAPDLNQNIVCFSRSEGYILLDFKGKMAAEDVVPFR